MSTRGIVLAWSAPSTLAQDALTPALPGVELLKAGKTEEAASALDEALANAWLQSPLTFRRVLFVNGTAIGMGHYSARDTNVFDQKSALIIYVEPFGHGWGGTGNLYALDIVAHVW